MRKTRSVAGWCDPRFSSVSDAFEANLDAGLEAGAACALVVDGRLMADVGHRS
jgi:hypothetical protein